MKKIYVISWHYSNDGWTDGSGGGGFDWYPPDTTREAVNPRFAEEVKAWRGVDAVIRLVQVDAPDELTGQVLTDWIDAQIDDLEVHWPALDEQVLAP
jgi:hypothetical protein